MNDVKKILESASDKERSGLRKILDTTMCESNKPNDLIRGLRWLHRSFFEDLYRDIFGKRESYKSIVQSACNRLKVKYKKSDTTEALEAALSQKVMETIWEKMTPEQQTEMEKELASLAEKEGMGAEWVKAGGATAAMVAAELSGFGIYMLATSGLSALAGLAGITLPFAAYTTLTTVMGVIIGPVGWVGVGLYAIWQLSGPNYKKLIPAILYIAMLRHRVAAR